MKEIIRDIATSEFVKIGWQEIGLKKRFFLAEFDT
jgi:hypothetical protein